MAATSLAASLGRGEGEPLHVRPVGGLCAAGYLSVGRAGVGFAGFPLEPGEQPGLAAGGIGGGGLSGPSGIGGDAGAQAALLRS